MSLLEALFLGALEGFTEFLPISSTGHLIIAQYLLGIEMTEFEKSFTIAVQLGAVLAVLATYFWRFFEYDTMVRLLAAFVPTAVVGLLLHSFFKEHLAGNVWVVAAALIIGGVVLIVFERFQKSVKVAPLPDRVPTYREAALIGLAQTLAIIPGVSRSGAAIVGGVMMGIPRSSVVEFSFLLAVPTIGAATVLDIAKVGFSFSQYEWLLLGAALMASFVVGMLAIRFLIAFVKKYSLEWFGWYRIVLGSVLLAFFL